MDRKILLVLISLFWMAGCAAPPVHALPPVEPTSIPIEIPQPTRTSPPVPTHIPPTPTITPSPTPILSRQGPGSIVCPILLYHRIAVPKTESEYYVTPDEFRTHMEALKEWGYTTILPGQLIQAIKEGAQLPERPIIISFDDGDITVFKVAYPIMKDLEFVGVNYIVVNYIDTPGYMSTRQLKELSAAGWETGSHSMSHKDLTLLSDTEYQVVQSQIDLQEKLGVPIQTFAYPFGQKTEDVLIQVSEYYDAGMGLGSTVTQNPWNLYYLWRRPVKLGWDVQTLGSFLPWSSPYKADSP